MWKTVQIFFWLNLYILVQICNGITQSNNRQNESIHCYKITFSCIRTSFEDAHKNERLCTHVCFSTNGRGFSF